MERSISAANPRWALRWPRRLPEFPDRASEARYWDATDVTELGDELAEVTVERPPPGPSTTFSIRLDPATVADLRAIAQARNTGPTQLVRTWVTERLAVEQGARAVPGPDVPADMPQVHAVLVAALLAKVPDVIREAEAAGTLPRGAPG